jgi:hypothetical protein
VTLATGEKIDCTPEHPFYAAGSGFVEAKDLGIGTIVTRAGPAVQVALVERHNSPATVYNFVVEDTHTYFVGTANGGVEVHNACPPEYFGGNLSESGFLDNAIKYLGEGYTEQGVGRFVSQDGLRQVRFGKHEINSPQLHGHFEAYDKPNFAGGGVIENTRAHIFP